MSTPNDKSLENGHNGDHPHAEIGIVGGTGVYGLEGMKLKHELDLTTPFGKPSSKIVVGEVDGIMVAFLARHDTTHRLSPSEIPFRANIWALKSLGVRYLISLSACGSLNEKFKPGDIVLNDQFIDNTRLRQQSFFTDGIVAHVSMADPVCKVFRALALEVLTTHLPHTAIHDKGTYVCIEGPTFSTKAESELYRSWGGSVIGMTAIPEAKLAREAEFSYICICLVTDYDCWHPDHEHVTTEKVIQVLKANSITAQKAVREVVAALSRNRFVAKSHSALEGSILTHHPNVPLATYEKLKPIVEKYLSNKH